MAQYSKTSGRVIDDAVDGGRPARQVGTRSAAVSRPWWGRTWAVPLALIAIAFLAFSLPPYLTLDPARSRIPLRGDMHYVLLVAHILFGSVAMITACFQIWPWLRRNHPGVHRATGRIYVLGGVLPGALFSLAVMPFSAGPPGNAVAALLWLGTTIVGFRMGMRRRFAEHRRWMFYSVALTFQGVWGRIMLFILLPLIPAYNPKDPAMLGLALETATWIGFVVNLVGVQLWLDRTRRRGRRVAL
jgi:hypothetical protein